MLNKIAVVARAVSNTPELIKELENSFEHIKLNKEQKLQGADLAEFIGNAEGALVALEPINEEILDKCKNLKIISKFGVGLDNIDLEACQARNIEIGWTPGTNKLSVAEMALGFMIAISRNLFKASSELKNGVWNKDGGSNLSGSTIGIVGVGNVGKEVIRLLSPFNCRILVNDIVGQTDYYKSVGVEEVSKEELFSRADIVSLHVPLTYLTKNMVNETVIASMKTGAYIINTARGPIVDHLALKTALQSKKLGGAAIDVYDEEPPADTELLSMGNLICTPHIGGNSRESVLAMGRAAIDHLVSYFKK